MKRNVSCAMLATLVIALTGPVLPAKAQECTAPSEFGISAAQERTVTRSLNASQMRELNLIAGRLAEGQSYRQIEAQWKGLASQLRGSNMDVVALVQFALCEAYQGTNADLLHYAEKVKFFNELKKAIREEISRLRGFKSSLERGDRQTDFRPTMSVWQLLTSNYRPPAVIRATAPIDAILSEWDIINAGPKWQALKFYEKMILFTFFVSPRSIKNQKLRFSLIKLKSDPLTGINLYRLLAVEVGVKSHIFVT